MNSIPHSGMRIVALHLSILDGVTFLWGENAIEVESGVRDEQHGCPVSPRDPGRKGLQESLRRVASTLDISRNNTSREVVWLPSQGGRPLPSSPVLGPPPDRRRKTAIAAFATTVRHLSIRELVALTTLSESPASAGTGVVFGASIAWCRSLLNLVLAVGMSESFLPGLIRNEKCWEARWMRVPEESIERHLADLATSMPASCRCMSRVADTPPETPPELAAGRALAGLLDDLVRRADAAVPVDGNGRRGDRNGHASLHDAWLAALTSSDAVVSWPDQEELKDFSNQLGQWQRPVDLTARSSFRLCFRLSEPAQDGDDSSAEPWQVDYLLQAKADPSLLVPVADLWKPQSEGSQQMTRLGGKPVEFLLTALGQASGLCTCVAQSLKTKHPGGFALNAFDAFVFLRDQAQALQEAGFAVMLPSWWVKGGPARGLGLRARASSPKMQAQGGLSLETMVDFDISASLGGETLSLQELRALARLKVPLVRVRGQWTQIDLGQVQTALRFLEKRQSRTISARDLVGVALGAEHHFGGLSVEAMETDGWLADLLDTLTGRQEYELIDQPLQFAGKLRPYQQRGLSWLALLRCWGLGACLADDMGLGKTVQTLALIQREREAGERRPVLLVCPTTVVGNWRKETERFTPELKVLVHHGPDRHRKEGFSEAVTRHGLVVSSYGLLQRDVDILAEIDWAGVILDEAQNIKNPETKQFKAARAIRADYRVALTGTPVENHIGDLWALMAFLNPGLLGSQNAFRETFYQPIQIWKDTERAARLKALTGPFILRRLKIDRSIITDLPEKIELKEYCTLTREQATLYQAVLDDVQERLEQAEGMERRGLVLATLSKLKQVCNHPAQFAGDGSDLDGRSGKLARLQDILLEIREMDERTLVFTQFAEMGKLLQQYFQTRFGEEIFFLHGGVPRKRREEMVDLFQNDPQAPSLFILSLKAGGTGLTLTRANHVVHFDRWWNPAVENQATDRAFRIGQQRNVQVHKLIVAGTLEERIDEMIELKTGIAEQVVGTGEQWLTELADQDLRELIRLGAEAGGD